MKEKQRDMDKSKERKEHFCVRRTVKNHTAVFCLILTAIFLLGLCTLPISANENAVMQENYKKIEEYATLLGDEINIYTAKDTMADKALSKTVAGQINLYRKKLLDLQSHDSVGKVSLEKEILLYHAKGKAAGRIAWIYYSNLSGLTDSSAEAVREVYNGFCLEIEEAEDHAVLCAREDGMANEANKCIFSEKINALSREGDSLASASIISGALEEIKNTSDTSLDGDTLSGILSDTLNRLTLQRARDEMEKELFELFPIIRPGESYSESSAVTLFIYKIKDETDLKGMNEVYREALCELISGEEGRYVKAHTAELSSKLSNMSAAATERGEWLCASPAFLDYSIQRKRAQTKDKIAMVLAEAYSDLEIRFNGKGGLVDKADSTVKINAELVRAEYIKKLYDLSGVTKNSIGIIMGSYDAGEIIQSTEDCRKEYENELFAQPSSQTGFGESCKLIFSEAETAFAKISNEAKAKRFLLDYKEILIKEDVSLGLSDKNILALAISDYCGFDEAVRGLLKGQINNICRKYNTVLSIEIREIMKDDSFYLDLCERLCESLQEISLENPEEYYEKSKLVKQKAEALANAVGYYRAFMGEELYESYANEDKKALEAVCTALADDLSKLPLDTSLEGSVASLLKGAKLSMDKTNQSVRIKEAVGESQNQKVLAISAEAIEKIKASLERQELIALVDKAVFKIKRELAADELSRLKEEYKIFTEECEFLTDKEKAEYTEKLSALAEKYRGDILLCENMTVLGFLLDTGEEKLAEIKAQASELDLSRAKEEYGASFQKEAKDAEGKIQGLALISDEKKNQYRQRIAEILTEFSSKGVSCRDTAALKSLYSDCHKKLSAALSEAEKENLGYYKQQLYAELDKFSELEQNYSKASFEKIKNIIESTKKQLEGLSEEEECKAVFEKARENIFAIGDKLYDAKKQGREELNRLYAEATAVSGIYSAENLKTIKQLHAEALLAIDTYQTLDELSALENYLAEIIGKIKTIKKELVYTGDEALVLGDKNPQYPASYSPQKDGYWACISAVGGLDYSAVFTARPGNEGTEELNAIERLIHEAARKKKIVASHKLSSGTLRLLKKCDASLALDLKLENNSAENGVYTVRILLPSTMKEKTVIGVVFVGEDGQVEFCNTATDGNLLAFETTHFSSYYVVTESTFDLMPFIRFLIALLVVEIIVLALVLLIRYYRKQRMGGGSESKDDGGSDGKSSGGSELPISLSAAVMPSLALRVIPQNGEAIAILLSLAALTLGCAVALLAQIEIKALIQWKEQGNNIFESKKEKRPYLLLLLADKFSSKGEKNLEERKDIKADPKSREHDVGSDGPLEAIPEEELCPVYLDSEVDGDVQVMSDEGAYTYSENNMAIDEKDNYHDYDPEKIEKSIEDSNSRRAEINIDEIAALFDKGDTVTVDMLKKKKLIGKKTEYVKVLARGNLTKPLKIYAHDFSRAAEEMLRTVGGEAIRIEK